LISVGKVGANEIMVPKMDRKTAAIAIATEQYRNYVNTIDSESVKAFVNSELRKVVQTRNELKRELEAITNPLVSIRRDALASKQAAENLFAPAFAGLEVGERILKTEILRYENVLEQKRLTAEVEARREAEQERQRVEAEAQRKAQEAAEAHRIESEKAQALERAGNQAEADRLREEAERNLIETSDQIQAEVETAEHVAETVTVQSESVKLAGTAVTGTWVAEVADVLEVLAGIVAKETPISGLRLKVKGKLVPFAVYTGPPSEIEGIEINLPWFTVQAREQQKNFAYRGMKSRFVQNLRVS
jgi:hypothetical protein